jgi:hypothetical protein
MSRLNKKTEEKVNTIVSQIEGLLLEVPPKNETEENELLSTFSDVICQFDTDIAIEVMNNFGVIGKKQSLNIKIKYGY